MFFRRPNLGLPRRVVAYYLLFCVIAVAWLSVGVLVTSHSVLNTRGINSSLSRLGKLTAALEVEYIRGGLTNLQSLISQAKSEFRAHYCSIESPAGKFLAHSNPQFIGQKVQEHEGSHLRWGSITGVRFTDEAGKTHQEYRTTLMAHGQPFGSLRVAVSEPSIWSTFSEVARLAPIAILIPLGVVALGAVVLGRVTSPMSEISKQLQKLAESPQESAVELTAVPVHDTLSLGWNRIVEALARFRENPENQSLEQRLQAATSSRRESQHADILQNLPEGVAVTDMEGRITFVNRAVASLLGETVPEGTEMQKWLCPSDDTTEAAPLLDPQLASRPAVCELHRHGEHADRVLRVSRQPVKNPRIQGQVWCLRDITQQKLAEKMRDQFIDTATHELRTPLSNIKAYAETMVTCDEIDIEEQKEFCNIINSEVTRLARFVDDLLSISSMEMGSLSIDKQKVETARMLEEVLEKVDPVMQQKSITFTAELPEKMPEVRLDKDKFIAVLVNLLGNAAKYTPNGGRVTLRVKLDNSLMQVDVEDTGVGIAPEEVSKVFEKFFRSSDPRVQNETGTGLGLSLASEVVRMHGGEITVESVLDQGSTFTITIPVE
jgi:two-component system phosphate regulon sensor histidine kinase PhoR